MAINQKAFLVDFESLKSSAKGVRPSPAPVQAIKAQSTVFTLGLDPRINAKPQMSTPVLSELDFLKDGNQKPYVNLHWTIPRTDVAEAGVIGFNVYRVFSGTLTSSFSRVAYDKIAQGSIKLGYFAATSMAHNSINTNMIPPDIFNVNMNNQNTVNINNFGVLLSQSSFQAFPQNNVPKVVTEQKIAFVKYSTFVNLQAQRTVDVVDQNFIEITYADKSVKYGDILKYYITSVTSDFQEGPSSNEINVIVTDRTPISPPSTVIVKQIDETSILLRISLHRRDQVDSVLIYRKAEDEVVFSHIATAPNINDIINLLDSTVKYGKLYTYRVFCKNIFGTLSQPKESTYTSSVQNLTNRSRSNNLKIPILTAIQDQNSNNINIIMASNDPLISFYILDRRDLTINEKLFTVPSQFYGGNIFGSTYNGPAWGTSYGTGNPGWVTNKFFVDNSKNPVGSIAEKSSDVLNRIITGNELIFQDTTVQPGHIYEYRVCGSDLFGNLSSYAFSQVTSTGKKILRSPINLTSSRLREKPLRILIDWNDDNLAITFSASQLSDNTATNTNPYLYRVQRREFSDTVYESFPTTVNTFLVDEVASTDALPLFPQKIDENNIFASSSVSASINLSIQRPFNVPKYLLPNKYYYYRIQVSNLTGDQSNFTEEFQVSTFPDLSDPISASIFVDNSKVNPLIAHLTWGVENQKVAGDFYTIERKFDTPYDTYQLVGKSYIDLEFFDTNIQTGNTYVYRIQSIDTLKRTSNYAEVRLTI